MISKNWQDLSKPNKLEVKVGDDPKRFATVVARPLERGFGMTLGNALRRVLLSSLQGAAVTVTAVVGAMFLGLYAPRRFSNAALVAVISVGRWCSSCLNSSAL